MAFILHKKDGQNVVALQLIAKAVLDLSKSQAAIAWSLSLLLQIFGAMFFVWKNKSFLKTMSLLVRGLDRSSNPGG